jgi:hypothetical protein
MARVRLKGLKAKLFTGNELQKLNFKANFVVSFSVLEHVYDRRLYLQTAKEHLAQNGFFYITYDDGHFRNFLDLNRPRLWLSQYMTWIHNLMTEPLARAGKTSKFQKRVNRTDIDRLIAETGFQVKEVFYSNLASLKALCKTIQNEKLVDFAHFWLSIENELNNRFLLDSSTKIFEDTANLWQVMSSRTLILCHKEKTDYF